MAKLDKKLKVLQRKLPEKRVQEKTELEVEKILGKKTQLCDCDKVEVIPQQVCVWINTENIEGYYALLKEIFDEFNFESHPERIYNMDKTGMPLNPRPPKVVAAKGQKKV